LNAHEEKNRSPYAGRQGRHAPVLEMADPEISIQTLTKVLAASDA